MRESTVPQKPRLNLNKKIVAVILTVIIGILAIGIVSVLIFLYNQPPQIRGIQPLISIQAMEPDSAKWGLNFPNQYSTYLKTATNNQSTKYGGSVPLDKLQKDKRLVSLFAGYAFSKMYTEDRGHGKALEDVRGTARVDNNTLAGCYSCKSSDNPRLITGMGMAKFDITKFNDPAMNKDITNPIGCANCHEANTMRLIVTNPALDAALKAQGKDWKTFTRQEMRSLVCANCHVEYSFQGDGKLLTYPWSKGTSIEKIEQFYDEIKFNDWTHKDSGAGMIKTQHPEYELFTANSTHYRAGVSCADCHMPYLRDGAIKFSNHDIKSPLIEINKTCAACHTDVEYVYARATLIQDQVWETMDSSETAIVDAIQAIAAAASNPKSDSARLAEARALHRKAQLRWDFIAAENSMGFHNPEEALRILASATDFARQAQVKALSAAAAQ